MKLLNSLAKMDLQPGWFQQRSKAVSGTVSCRNLLATVEKLHETASQVNFKPPLDPEAVWQKLEACRFALDQLDTREIRTLCLSPKTATKAQLIKAMEKNIGVLSKTPCLAGLINAYFINWEDKEQRRAAQKVIRTALGQYPGRNPIIVQFGNVANSLFSDDGPDFIAQTAVPQKQAVSSVLKRHFISLSSGFGKASLGACINRFIRDFSNRDRSREVKQEHLEYALEHLLIKETATADFYALIECLILSGAAEQFEEFRRLLREYILRESRLGDPRLPRSTPNWVMLPKRAADRFLSWLARESIIFFFNYVLPDNHENSRRKNFWLRYYAQVRDFQVALSDADYRRLSAFTQRHEVPEFSRVNSQTTSAFLIRFGDERSGYYVIEFSEVGNAAYIFAGKDFLENIRSLRRQSFEVKSELKHTSKVARIIHNGQWEYTAEQQLAQLGIRR